jgi:hypothetical protein
MNQKNDVEKIYQNQEENEEDNYFDYNDDFISDKTKSLNKFPLKLITNEDFYKNFSKSLKFNSHKCFAPKPKIKQSSKNPTPLIFEKQNDIKNLNTDIRILNEDAYSEKELSLNESSFSSDFENEINNKKSDNNDLMNNLSINNNNNYIISKSLLENNYSDKKSEDKDMGLFENKINVVEDEKEIKDLKKYGHKTITVFSIKNNNNDIYQKGNIKSIRNSLFRAKLKILKDKNKEVEYFLKNKMKIKYRLNLINNNSKKNNHNFDFYKIIPININNDEEKSNQKGNNIDDMSNFRQTIKYNNSKLNSMNKEENKEKGVTIYDVLLTNKKNKIQK